MESFVAGVAFMEGRSTMRRSAFGAMLAVAAGAFATPALADDPLANYYGNTLVAKGAHDDWQVWYLPDHTYTAEFNDHPISGTWSIEGDKVCLYQITPTPVPDTLPRCYPVQTHKVGESWTT